MPIKLPKSFARRKSSGNILEDVESQPQSFRVFERPGPHRAMTDGGPLTKPLSAGHAVPAMLEDNDNIFAGAEKPLGKNRYETLRPKEFGSLRKRLTRHLISATIAYESSTSTRLSSSSTQPSSMEVPSHEDVSPHSRNEDIPALPAQNTHSTIASGFLAAARTFSFGGKNKPSNSPAPPRHATPDEYTRNRAMTNSTDETATPPKLTDEEFNLGASSDDFGKMFDHLGKRESALLRDPSPRRANQFSSSPPTQALPEFAASGRAARPLPINTDRSAVVEPSPYSWNSRHSEEGLLHDPDEVPLGDRNSHSQPTPETMGSRRQSPAAQQMASATTSHRALDRPRRQSEMGLRRSVIYPGDRDSNPIDDEDALMVRKSLLWSRESLSPSGGTPLLEKAQLHSPGELSSPEPDSMFSNAHPHTQEHVDPAIADHARLAVQFAENLRKTPSPGNKVMTPSQFEHYRQQQELRRSNSNSSKSDDESDHEEFDEEDEAEKQREAERQRRKQEAHLSVYRQQMMKVTGQQAPSPSLRPIMSGASSSTPNLPIHVSSVGDKSSSGKSNDDDDDEVPLGILAAHGFPNRNRPPTRLANASSNPNLRASIHPYASSSTSLAGAEQQQDHRGNLPVFARNLPRDPYFGASLVNPANRESLAMGGGSVYGGPAATPPVPTGGLVGVIAQEEQARAMRRGSPNTQAMYDMGGVPRPYSMMSPPLQQQQAVSASEQSQVQLNNQMSTMIHMQMEWMQQMMRMQGMQGPPPMMQGGMPMPPHMMGAPPMPGTPMGPPSMAGPPHMPGPGSVSGNSNMRPVSMPGLAPSTPNNYDQRPLSMLDPNIAVRRTGSPMPNIPGGSYSHNSPGYAPSIAPSERSNAGLAPRYRPVSVQGDPAQHLSPMNRPYNDENRPHSHLSVSQTPGNIPKSTTLATVTVRPVSQASQAAPAVRKPYSGSDDENDDEAWADMMKRRDKKKSSWKLKRGTSSFGDLLGAVH
ncbi:hypothetical protein N7456_011835 [Penicillium angulare]|uniref:Uncharacterized protein n=1 Tax=Penicillium angulare TaxID=116970 RepID=A0A9W9EUL7_9EURO|nr:hypothetical protein N7456_011835 [Penicillium angulare]